MAKIRYDVSDVDPNESGGGEQPKAGVYDAQLVQLEHRVSGEDKKGDDDDLEVVVKIINEDKAYAQLWDYVGLGKRAKWKLDQFLRATSVAGFENKRKGEFDPEKIAKAMPKFKIRVKGESYEDDYKAKIGAYLAPLDGSGDDASDPFKKGKGKASKKSAPEPEPEDDEEDEEEEAELYDAEELEELTLKEIKAIARDWDVDVVKGKKKTDYIDEIIDAQADVEDEEEPEDPEEDEPEEDEEDEEDVEYSYDDLTGMKIKGLRELADELEIDHDGLRKAQLVEEIAEELGVEEDEDEDEDEPPF